MEALVAVGVTPCVSSSLSSIRSSTERCSSLSYTPSCKLILPTHHHHLAAFQPPSHVFSNSLHAKKKRKKNHHKTHIFPPHLVASMEVEETYIMIKPDGVQRGLAGEIISRFEKKGFKLTGLKLFQCPKELAEEHYKDLSSKPFFPKLISYITSGPVVCMAWEGFGVVASARKLIGATNPLQAEPGTIRGDLAVQTGRNVVHGSDSPENGKREIGMAKTIRTARKRVTPPHVINDRIQKREIARLRAELEDSRQLNDYLEEEMRELLGRLAQAREMLRGSLEALSDARQVYPPQSEGSVNRDDDETEEEDPSEQPSE